MVLKLYGNIQSTNSQRVQVTLEELGVPYEFITIDFGKGEHKTPEYTAIQPFGSVPYIDDDGFKLYESRAIARYIALKYGGIGTLIPDPKDLQKLALFEQAASVEMSEFEPQALGLAIELFFKPKMFGSETDAAAAERFRTTLDRKLAVYDVILGKTKYVAGNEITLVDLFHLPYPAVLEKAGVDILGTDKYPNVARWWRDISSRPSWKKLFN